MADSDSVTFSTADATITIRRLGGESEGHHEFVVDDRWRVRDAVHGWGDDPQVWLSLFDDAVDSLAMDEECPVWDDELLVEVADGEAADLVGQLRVILPPVAEGFVRDTSLDVERPDLDPDRPLSALKKWWTTLGTDTFFAVSPPTRGRYTQSDGHEDAFEEIRDAGLDAPALLAGEDFGYAVWHWQSQTRAFSKQEMRDPLYLYWGGSREAVAAGIGAVPAGFEVRQDSPDDAFAVATPSVWRRHDRDQRRAARRRERDKIWEAAEAARVAAELEIRREAGVPDWVPDELDDSRFTYASLWDALADPSRGASEEHLAWLRVTLHDDASPLMAQGMCLEALFGFDALTREDLDTILPRWRKDFVTAGKDFTYTGWRHPLAPYVCALLATDHPEADRVLAEARKLKQKWTKDLLLHAHPYRPTEGGYQECLRADLDATPRALRTRAALRGHSVSTEVDELLTRIEEGDPHPDFQHAVIVRGVAVEEIPGQATVFRTHASDRHYLERCLLVAEDSTRAPATRRAMVEAAGLSFLISDPARMSPPAAAADGAVARERRERARDDLGD